MQLEAMAEEESASLSESIASLGGGGDDESSGVAAAGLDLRNPALTVREPGVVISWHDRVQSEALLRNRAPGSWMLRASRVPGCLTLSALSNRTRSG